MIAGVRTIHRISQKRLKGSPRTIGSMRSQRGTEKQTATKGINPIRIAPSEGFFIADDLPQKNGAVSINLLRQTKTLNWPVVVRQGK
jgi:hypothetical protein